MKKLLLILLAFPALLFALTGDTATTSGKWSGIVQTTWSLLVKPGATEMYVHKTGVNDTCDIDTTVGGVLTQGSGTLWFPAGRVLHVLNNMFDSSTGTARLPDSLIFDGASSIYRNSAGNGVRTFTATNFVFNGTTGCFFQANKTTAIHKTLTIGPGAILTNNGSVAPTFSSVTTPLIIGNGATFTNTIGITVTSLGSVAAVSLPASYTWNGGGDVSFVSGTDNQIITFPAITYTGTGLFSLTGGNATNADTMLGAVSTGGQFQFIGNTNGKTTTVSTKNNSINCKNFRQGAGDATAILQVYLGSSAITATAMTGPVTAGTTNINYGTAAISCGGSITWGSNWNMTDSSARSSLTITNTSTYTSATRTWPGSLTLNAATKVITFVNKFRVGGDLTITAGKPIFAAGLWDTVVGNYTNNLAGGVGTDSLDRNNDTMFVGGSFTTSGAVKNNLGVNKLYGTALCNITTNGTTVNRLTLVGTSRAKQLKPIDNLHCRFLRDSTGTVVTNGKKITADSLIVINDSLYIAAGDTVTSPKVLLSATAKPNNAGLLYFGLALKDTLWGGNTTSIGKVTENKSGDTLTQVGVVHEDAKKILAGGYRMSAATDTDYCTSLLWNSTAPATIIAPIVCSGQITVAAGASITYSGVGKIVATTCTAATLNGNSVRIYYPTIGPIDYASSPWIDTVGKTATHAITFGGCTLGFDSVVAITALPTGYSIAKTGANRGLISWDGTGVTTAAGAYTIRAYSNEKTDWASVDVSMGIIARKSTGIKRFRFGFGFGF